MRITKRHIYETTFTKLIFFVDDLDINCPMVFLFWSLLKSVFPFSTIDTVTSRIGDETGWSKIQWDDLLIFLKFLCKICHYIMAFLINYNIWIIFVLSLMKSGFLYRYLREIPSFFSIDFFSWIGNLLSELNEYLRRFEIFHSLNSSTSKILLNERGRLLWL